MRLHLLKSEGGAGPFNEIRSFLNALEIAALQRFARPLRDESPDLQVL